MIISDQQYGELLPFVKDEKTWYRVIAGSFKDKNLAEQRVKNLSAKGYDGGFVTAFRK